uniref:Uncharacterized protein n=1 Tax=Aegilops tauschii TaxID=37682 RepID=M8AYN7_AEGTA
MVEVEVAYDMLLMQSLSRRRAGKVVDNSVRYADVKPVKTAGTAPQWMQSAMKNVPLTLEAPASSSLGIQSSIYGALMVFTYASGTSTSLPSAYTSPDVPGFILATGFGASLYFLSKKNMNLGKFFHHFVIAICYNIYSDAPLHLVRFEHVFSFCSTLSVSGFGIKNMETLLQTTPSVN